MSSNFLDVGDFQRLEREATLTEELPRQPIEEDRSPIEEPENPFDFIFDGLMAALERRLQ